MIPSIIALASQKIREQVPPIEDDATALVPADALHVTTKREGDRLHVAICFVVSLDGAPT